MLVLIPPLFLALMIAALLPGTAAAQASSTTGSITIDMTIDAIPPTMIQINGLEDLEIFDRGIGIFPTREKLSFCVYMSEDGTYSLDASAKPLEAQGAAPLPFNIRVTDVVNFRDIDANVFFDDLNGVTDTFTGLSPSRVENCADRTHTTELRPQLQNPPTEAGLFTTILTLTVRPE